MARFLQILAALCACGVILFWVALGAHRGWTRTETTTTRVDPVTEISYPEIQKGFVPGVDFLVTGLLGSAVFFGIGFGLSKLKPKTPTS